MTTRTEIFGGTADAMPALEGTYGYPPSGYRLPALARPGAVHLAVTSLQRSTEYYERVLGLSPLVLEHGKVSLHAGGDATPLIVLHEQPGVRRAPRRAHLGLFHFAILLPTRAALAQFVRHLGETGVGAGAGDHLVSEAFYLTDPDGLGIEVYADRPRESWMRQGRELMMATDPVDVPALLEHAGQGSWEGMPAGTVMGHVHLHVGDIATAGAFYSEALGFDRMVTRYPGALFLAAGGYHHHLGANTWAGPSAVAPGASDARLLEWTLFVPHRGDLDAVAASLQAHGHEAIREDDTSLVTRDPWGTQLRLVAQDGQR